MAPYRCYFRDSLVLRSARIFVDRIEKRSEIFTVARYLHLSLTFLGLRFGTASSNCARCRSNQVFIAVVFRQRQRKFIGDIGNWIKRLRHTMCLLHRSAILQSFYELTLFRKILFYRDFETR